MEILSKCDHPNIIKLHGAFEDKENIYMILEYADGGNLYQKMKKTGKFKEDIAKNYMWDIIKAVIYLHGLKPAVIHRDIKPENILIWGN